MMKKVINKVVAIFLVPALLVHPGWANPFSAASSPFPHISVSGRYGQITDSFAPPASHQPFMVLIQDLHANVGVQKNISHLILDLVKKLNHPRVMSEGGFGRGDISVFKNRQAEVIDALLQNASIDGVELAAIQSGDWIQIEGLEDPVPYLENVKAYRESHALRPEALAALRKQRAWMESGASPELKTHLFRLQKLLTLKLTRREWFAYQQEKSLNPQGPSALTQAIAASENFYRLALIRDGILARHALEGMAGQPFGITVTGGFHTEGITQRLKNANVPFIVITPNVDQLDNESVYERSLTEYLKGAEVSTRRFNALNVQSLPTNVRALGQYVIRRITNPIRRLAASRRRPVEVRVISTPWYLSIPAKIAVVVFALVGGYFLLHAGIISKGQFSAGSLSLGLLWTVSVDESGVEFSDGDKYTIPVGDAWEINAPGSRYQTSEVYRIERYKNSAGQMAFVVKVNNEFRLAMRDNTHDGVFESFPMADVTTQWEKEQHLEVLYNVLSMYRQKEQVDIQALDAVFKEIPENQWRSGHNSILIQKQQKGIVDRLGIYRYLAKARGTMAPAQPDYEVPHLPRAIRAALIVDPETTNIEAAILRYLMGNPDIDIPVIVGVSPIQLFVTMHSSVYRYFLPRDVFDYNEAEGWVRIYNKKIRVVSALNAMPSGEWANLNIHTVISTRNSSDDAEAIALALHGGRESTPAPINLVSMQPFFSAKPAYLYGDSLNSGHLMTQIQSGKLQLVSSRLRIPALFLQAFFADLDSSLQPATKVSLVLMSPHKGDAQILDKPREVSGLTNPIQESPEVARAVREWLYKVASHVIPPDGLTKPIIINQPTQVGTRAIVGLQFSLERIAKALGDDPQGLPRDQEALEQLIQQHLERHLLDGKKTLTVEGEGPLFEVEDSPKVGDSYSRAKNMVIIDTKKIMVSVTGSGNEQEVTCAIPLLFDDQYQDARHLERVLYKLGAVETRNANYVRSSRDQHHSDWQDELELAAARGTLPPVEPDLPTFSRLAEKPLKLGIVSVGRTATLFIRSLTQTLNISLRAIQGPQPAEAAQTIRVDSTFGTFMSNSREVKVSARKYETARKGGQVIGTIKINDDRSIPILARALPNLTDWAAADVDTVFDATGNYLDNSNPEDFFGHLQESRSTNTGARMGFLSNQFKVKEAKGAAPAVKVDKSDDPLTVVAGVNSFLMYNYLRDRLEKAKAIMISGATCTTTCLATALKADDEMYTDENLQKFLMGFGIHNPNAKGRLKNVIGTTVHAVTNTQPLIDSIATRKTADHTKMRSAKGSTPSPTGASGAIKKLKVLLAQAKKAKVKAIRVPVETGSYLPLATTWAIDNLTPEERQILLEANKHMDEKTKEPKVQLALKKLQIDVWDKLANDPSLNGLIEHRRPDEATASATIVGSRAAAVFDSREIQLDIDQEGETIEINKVIDVWYDNEWGYSFNTVRSLDQAALEIEMAKRDIAGGHAFYIPSFFEVLRSIHNSLFGSFQVLQILSFPLAVLSYVAVLPRYVMVNAYAGGNRLAVTWKAFTQGHLFGYHHTDGRVEWADGLSLSPRNWAMQYLQTHERQPNERSGLFGTAVLFGTHPIYSLAAIISAFPVWAASRHALTASPPLHEYSERMAA